MDGVLEFAAGVGSAVTIGAALALLKSRLTEHQRRSARQLEIAEMVGAVRAEIGNTSSTMRGIVMRLDTIDHTLRSLDSRLDEHITRGRHHRDIDGEELPR